MSQTTEVRWLLPGLMPEALRHWFQVQPAIAKPVESREDWYLWLPGQRNLGIKLRQGRLEIKQRWADHGLQSFTPQVGGQVESWQKWSFGLQDNPLPESQPPPRWISVQKNRQIKVYRLQDGPDVVPVAPESGETNVCEVEITEIYADDRPWYSLGLEATGADRDQLLRVATALLSTGELPCLTPENSYSYPSWLSDRLG